MHSFQDVIPKLADLVLRAGSTSTLCRPPKVGILGGGQLGKMLAMEAVGHHNNQKHTHRIHQL